MEKVLGRGVFGRVKEFGQYAVKRINNEYLLTGIREVLLLSKCNHPNVVKMIKVEPDHVIAIVMERWDSDLRRYLETNPLPEIELVEKIACDLLKGVKYIHSVGIIHNDIKPANVLINTVTGEVALCDFGMSVLDTVNNKSCIIQTKIFRAPEVNISISHNYSYSVDVWSFGCILYNLCTGVNLFNVETDDDITIDLSLIFMVHRSTRTSRIERLWKIDKNEVAYVLGGKIAHLIGKSRLNAFIQKGIFDVMIEALIPNPQERLKTTDSSTKNCEILGHVSNSSVIDDKKIDNGINGIITNYTVDCRTQFGEECVLIADQLCDKIAAFKSLDRLDRKAALVMALSLSSGMLESESEYPMEDQEEKEELVQRISELLAILTNYETKKI